MELKRSTPVKPTDGDDPRPVKVQVHLADESANYSLAEWQS